MAGCRRRPRVFELALNERDAKAVANVGVCTVATEGLYRRNRVEPDANLRRIRVEASTDSSEEGEQTDSFRSQHG